MRLQNPQRQILRALAGVILLWTFFGMWAKLREYKATQTAISVGLVSGRAFVTIVERDEDLLSAEFWVRSVYQSHGRSAHPVVIIPTTIAEESIARLESIHAHVLTEAMLQEYLLGPGEQQSGVENNQDGKNKARDRTSVNVNDLHQISGFPVSFSTLRQACKDYYKAHRNENCPYWRALVFSLGKYHTIAYTDPNITLLGNISHLLKNKSSFVFVSDNKGILTPPFFVWKRSHQPKSGFNSSFKQLEESLLKTTPGKDPLTLLDVAIKYSLSTEAKPKNVPYTLEKFTDFSKTHPISRIHPNGLIMYSWDKSTEESQLEKCALCGPKPYSSRGEGVDAALWTLWHDVDSRLNDIREPLVNAQEASDCQHSSRPSDGHNFTAIVYSKGENPNRVIHMKKMITSLSDLKECHKIIVVWNTMQEPPPSFKGFYGKHPNLKTKLVIKLQDFVSPNNRLRPYKEIETRTVFVLNDNVALRNEDISLIYHTSQQLHKTLIGIEGTLHHDFNGQFKILESKAHTYEYSMIQPHIMALDRDYLYNYTCKMDKAVRSYVDSVGNCEDIALNMLVADAAKIPPMLVEARPTIYNDLSASDLQNLGNIRAQCLNAINEVYDSKMPLKTSSNMIRPYFSNSVERFVMNADGSIESVYVYYAHMANSAGVYVMISCLVLYFVLKKSNYSIFR